MEQDPPGLSVVSDIKLYNVDLEANTAIAEYPIQWESRPLADVIADMQAAAEGLESPSVEITAEEYYDSMDKYLFVSGKRQMTDAEREGIIKERDVERRRREHMAKFKP